MWTALGLGNGKPLSRRRWTLKGMSGPEIKEPPDDWDWMGKGERKETHLQSTSLSLLQFNLAPPQNFPPSDDNGGGGKVEEEEKGEESRKQREISPRFKSPAVRPPASWMTEAFGAFLLLRP